MKEKNVFNSINFSMRYFDWESHT